VFKTFFQNFNNAIQWSKKYHFFHILAIPSFFYIANIFWLCVITFLQPLEEPVMDGIGRALGIFYGLLIVYFLVFILLFVIIALISQIIIFIKYRKRGTIQVSSLILLEDKVYHFFYIYTYITLIFVFIFLLLVI